MKILISEDDDGVRAMLAAYFSDQGHAVRSAENGQVLIKLALEEKPDLIITDMNMPEMAGDSMIAVIDMYPPLAGIPIIMVTGATPDEIEDAGIPEGIPVLSKPVDFDKLSAQIAAIFGGTGE